MKSIFSFTLKDLQELLSEWKVEKFRARQILNWLYKRNAISFSQMTDLNADLRKKLEKIFSLYQLKPIREVESRDGTRKFLFCLEDKDTIEAVLIPTEKRITACISTQVGCRFACKFCASGRAGFKRNLSAGEIVQQVLLLGQYAKKRLDNLVFMGIGEPLDNYDNVLRAIRIINAPWGPNIGARKITVSTSGFIPGIQRLMQEGLQIELSVSLHAADDKTRNTLMPINKTYPLKELIPVLKEYINKTNRQITFEYVLIEGINSDISQAEALGRLLKGMNCKINLIPCNPIENLGFYPPGKLSILLFKDKLLKDGITATVRIPRGRDIEAACGQLKLGAGKGS